MNSDQTRQIQADDPLIARLHRALGPLAGGFILDTVDLITFGPIGLAGGLFIGFAVGWWITSIYEFERTSRTFWALVAGIYCLVPFTELIPVATIVSAVGRFRERNKTAPQDVDSNQPSK